MSTSRMTHEEALDKAVKFLKLSRSDNPHEAAAAAAKAQEIMDRYKLEVSLDAVDSLVPPSMPEEPIKEFSAPLNEEDAGKRNRTNWRIWLSVHIAQANHCKVFVHGPNIQLIGRPSDAETVRHLYAVLVREVDRLAERDAKGNGRTWANNYRVGVVETLGQRLAESQAETQNAVRAEAFARGGETAIVLVNRNIEKFKQRGAAVDAWVKANKQLSRGRAVSVTTDAGAREAGRKAGHEVRLGGARGGLGSGQRGLNS